MSSSANATRVPSFPSARQSSALSAFSQRLGKLLFPPLERCSLCGEPLSNELDDGICPQCLARMPWLEGPSCSRCGLPGVTDERRCPDCGDIPASFSSNRSLWRYEEQAREIVQLYKFRKRIHLAETLADLLATKMFCQDSMTYDILTYVPMHPQAERSRGYNQSAVLATALAERLSLPCQELLCKQQRQTPQHLLGKEERWRNLEQGVFALRTPAEVQGRVLLVDDVFTTGATAHFCSRLLLDAGAQEVAVLTIARG